ncbi:MAG: MAPEG family protein [Gammaproteobacteria bacterium]|nr:MAPEG family protein [Gammaproteobacteria bacterium]
MTFAYWCVALAAFLPLVWVGAAKYGAPGYDNAKPRIFLQNLNGWPQRANWAQANAYEAFPPFAAAVIIASVAGANPTTVDILAGTFIIARILHGVCYIFDKPTLRSLVWTIGFFAMIATFLSVGWSN